MSLDELRLNRKLPTETYPAKRALKGEALSLVVRQRDGKSAIYRSGDRFVRMGTPDFIAQNLSFHREVESYGFPVPRVLEEGSEGEFKYFIEESLGEDHLGEVFTKETEQTGAISGESFNDLLSVIDAVARAQLNAMRPRDEEGYVKGILLNEVAAEVPEHTELLREANAVALKRIAALPYVLSHGDCNPHNLYAKGIIDFEYTFNAPFGFDLMSAINSIQNFPTSKDYEFSAGYRFTEEQRDEYMKHIDSLAAEHGIGPVSAFSKELTFGRTIWSAARMSHAPKLQAFRFAKMVEEAKAILASGEEGSTV